MSNPTKQLAELNSFVMRAQGVLTRYLPDNSGVSEKQAIAELLGILDSRELYRLQKEIRASKPALFAP